MDYIKLRQPLGWYTVIYTVFGVRHRTLTDHNTFGAAVAEAALLRARGWNAWVERVA